MAPMLENPVEEVRKKKAKEAEDISKMEVNEEEFQSYMEEDTFSDEDWKSYIRARFENVKANRKALSLQRRELEMQKRDDLLDKLTKAFRDNHKEFKWVTDQLLIAGIKIEK